ncbi:hypothetical protein PR048_015430 [Dryococelus australis]|uniref:DNA polymerase n=1 Tax=Dryococelus australis TaxID=614101 RepID=A0ABQ9HGY0_9NEOP|nr:hypothetical protein PR048_015430 [Dryococelus australis]
MGSYQSKLSWINVLEYSSFKVCVIVSVRGLNKNGKINFKNVCRSLATCLTTDYVCFNNLFIDRMFGLGSGISFRELQEKKRISKERRNLSKIISKHNLDLCLLQCSSTNPTPPISPEETTHTHMPHFKSSLARAGEQDIITSYATTMFSRHLHQLFTHDKHYLTVFYNFLYTHSIHDLHFNPSYFTISCIWFTCSSSDPLSEDAPAISTRHLKMSQHQNLTYEASTTCYFLNIVMKINVCSSEIPPILQVEALSWGYLFERSIVLGLNLCPRVSRVPDSARDSHVASSQGDRARGDTHVAGRILLDVWRLMRHQVALQSYTYESVAYHVLHERRPRHSHRCLTAWWDHPSALYRWIVVEYYLDRTHGTVRLLEQLDLLTTTSELARLFGIQFHEVLTRGSQFRVESMMLRLAILHNYVAVSPSVKQRAAMRAPEHLQLIMEPESRFYSDPVIVLDFQSLYPSIIIAYNYCFSTCLGHARLLGQPGSFQFGCSELRVPLDLLEHLLPDITISPCGVAFVGPGTRLGILPRMLQEILRTRLMVKQAMKEHPEDKALQRVLHARQLGLKLIANVTYGYTAANFSGRMPCVEVGDSVVSKGRETLERAIQLVENTTRWHARVIYGDTDSMFVLVEGRSRAQAFAIGAEIAQAVTLDNPVPVKLKLEKVYQPCILQTKKRYVGYAYESPNQDQPKYDAKGIETVRRDGCPAVAKRYSIKILIHHDRLSAVRQLTEAQLASILTWKSWLKRLDQARPFRYTVGTKMAACLPSMAKGRRIWLKVPYSDIKVKERESVVNCCAAPSLPYVHCWRSPRKPVSEQHSQKPVGLLYCGLIITKPGNYCEILSSHINFLYDTITRGSLMDFFFFSKTGSIFQVKQSNSLVVYHKMWFSLNDKLELCRSLNLSEIILARWLSWGVRRDNLLNKSMSSSCTPHNPSNKCISVTLLVNHLLILNAIRYTQIQAISVSANPDQHRPTQNCKYEHRFQS